MTSRPGNDHTDDRDLMTFFPKSSLPLVLFTRTLFSVLSIKFCESHDALNSYDRLLFIIPVAVEDPGFSPGGCANSQRTIIFQFFAETA